MTEPEAEAFLKAEGATLNRSETPTAGVFYQAWWLTTPRTMLYSREGWAHLVQYYLENVKCQPKA